MSTMFTGTFAKWDVLLNKPTNNIMTTKNTFINKNNYTLKLPKYKVSLENSSDMNTSFCIGDETLRELKAYNYAVVPSTLKKALKRFDTDPSRNIFKSKGYFWKIEPYSSIWNYGAMAIYTNSNWITP